MLADQIKEKALEINYKLIQWRRHLHQNPELSYQEWETSKFIAQLLSEWGIKFQAGVAGTGVVGWIKGKNPSKKLFALRADMDALPILEANQVDYRSKNEGVMHACGHDVHSTCLLGAAYILQQLRNEWEGTIQLIFQPGEEKLPGGASLILASGILDNPRPAGIFGQHVEPDMEVGKIGIRSGLFMASADEVFITVKGKGGHGARPHQCIDPILIASHLIVALQQIVSRRTDPLLPAVLTFGKVYSNGGATNVIPDSVQLEGTFRCFDEEWRYRAHEIMRNMSRQLCESMGGSCEFEIAGGYPFVFNHEILTKQVQQAAVAYLGKENVLEIAPRMGAEDFAFYSQVMPSCFYRLGTLNPNGTGLHTPQFDIDENALVIGTGLMAYLALDALNK